MILALSVPLKKKFTMGCMYLSQNLKIHNMVQAKLVQCIPRRHMRKRRHSPTHS